MGFLDNVKGRLGFDDGDWEDEYEDDEFVEYSEDPGYAQPKRSSRFKVFSSKDEDNDEGEYYVPDGEGPLDEEPDDGRTRSRATSSRNDPAYDSPYAKSSGLISVKPASTRDSHVRLASSRPGYTGVEDREPASRGASGAATSDTGTPKDQQTSPRFDTEVDGSFSYGADIPRRSRGVVTGREVTTGLEQQRSNQLNKLHVMVPRSFGDAEMMGTRFKKGQPVLLDMRDVSRDTAKRILDFSFGLTFALDGSIQRIGDRVFLLTPRGVQLSQADRDRLVELGLIEG